jgi:colanic acid/amylovoran biosynthesis glycosyltransferase
MRIAFFVNKFPNLSETFILNQITGLIDRGLIVDIFARGRPGEKITHPDIERYNLTERTVYYSERVSIPENTLIRYLKAFRIVFSNLSSIRPLLRSLRPFQYGPKAYSLVSFYTTAKFLEDNLKKYDVIHCHFGPNGNIAALLKEVGLIRGKVVTVFHAYELTRLIQDQGEHVYDRLFNTGDLFMPISINWKLKLESMGCPANKIIVHRMGVNINQFQFIDRSTIVNGSIKILSVARLVEKKGIEYALRAFAQACSRDRNIEYIIAGDGPLRSELESLSRSLGIEDKVCFMGWKNQDEIAHLMRSVHIFLLPSVTSEGGDQEGLPVVLMEAMAQGIPVISTHHSGIPELVDDGVSGFLVPERNVDQLSEKLRYLIDNPGLWRTFGKAGRYKVEHEYDIHKLNNVLFDHFSSLILNSSN